MKKIDCIELGATLFVPATHKDILTIVSGEKYGDLKSVLIDFEDGVNQNEIRHVKIFLEDILGSIASKKLFVFIRAKDSTMLKEFLTCQNIKKVDGFILPKFSLSNAKEYLELFDGLDFNLMPSIEGKELYDSSKLQELKELLLDYKEKIILVRFGLEDMLRVLKMRRGCDESIFDFSISSAILGSFLATFKGSGFCVSGGVYPCFRDDDGFIKDVKRDLKEGLFSKTIIHPKQIAITNELYKVTKREFEEALELCSSDEAVFAQNSKMAEVVTMQPWAKDIIKRAEVYGVKIA